jgi:crossover junction endodeoxyribonuclease RusA
MSQIIVDLPWPPSLNRIWRSKGKVVYRDPKYVRWIDQAGWLAKLGKHQQVRGEFSATIVLNPPNKRKIDVDNRVKVLLDLAQRVGLVEDDCLCRLLVVSYGGKDAAPLGARLTISSFVT